MEFDCETQWSARGNIIYSSRVIKHMYCWSWEWRRLKEHAELWSRKHNEGSHAVPGRSDLKWGADSSAVIAIFKAFSSSLLVVQDFLPRLVVVAEKIVLLNHSIGYSNDDTATNK